MTMTIKTKTVTSNPTRARLIIAALAILFIAPAFFATQPAAAASPLAQKDGKPYALIFGTVWDKNDRPVYGVPVKIRLATEKKAKWELVSNHTGEFAQRVPVGPADYLVWLDIKTPKGTPKPQKIVHIQNDERADISMHLSE
jgi:hypothetical protein